MRLKKSLGQHFLKDEHIIGNIIDQVAELKPNRLLEVGPGGGALTGQLLSLPIPHFMAVEVDEEKVSWLRKQFPALQLIEGSFLDMQPPFSEDFMIVGNFPYNISSQIMFKVLDWFPLVHEVVGMFQKEVAQRIISPPGSKDYGILSVLIQYYYEGAYLFDVGRQAFTPPPRVESGVIYLKKRSTLLPVKSHAKFKSLVKSSFAQRRKTLRNNLKGMLPADRLADPLFDRRAETLSVQEFADLTFQIP